MRHRLHPGRFAPRQDPQCTSLRTSGERAVATLALTSCALLSPAVAGASLNDVDQAAPSVHRIKLFVDPAAVGDMGTAEGGRRLAQYTADVNTVFRRETVRRFVFDPATDLQRSSRRGCMCACWSAPRARCAPPSTDKACYERCRHLLRELEDAESSLAELSVNPRGRLRIDIHGAPANELGLPRIGEFHARYPHIELAVGSGDRLVDLVREGVDCVVRAGKPKDSSLVTRRLALIPQVTVASPAYLAANGTPLQPADLARHWAVNFFSASRTDFFPFDFEVEAVRRRTCCAAGSA
jgi:hypothetical protein